MILVTGGTGLVGSHLLYFLLQENEKIRAIHRKSSDIASVKKIFAHYTEEVDSLFNKIDWVQADITDIPALTKAFEGITHVYHCAAYISFNPAKYRSLKKANVEGTANVVNLSIEKNIKKLCYVSSVAVFARKNHGELIDEESFWNPDDKNSVYAITKYGAEMEVWRGTQEGLDAVIVNPGIILGISTTSTGSGVATQLGAKGIPFYPSGGVGVVDVEDVVKAMILLMNSHIINQQYILVGQNISYKDLLSKMAVLFGKNPPTRKLSKPLMYFLAALDGFANKVFGKRRVIVKDMVRSMFQTSYYDTSKIRKDLDFKFTPLEKTLEKLKP